MLVAIRNYLPRTRAGGHGLDYLLASAANGRTLNERLEWLLELLTWLRSTPRVADTSRLDFRTGHGQSVRFRHLMQALSHNPVCHAGVGKTCRSILRDIDALEVFRSTGIPGAHGLWSEAVERFTMKLVPAHLAGKDLGEAFGVLFPGAGDVAWIERLDPDTIQAVATLLATGAEADEAGWNTLPRDMGEALFLLASEAQTLGLSPMLRRRRVDRHHSSFLPLEDASSAFLAALQPPAAAAAGALTAYQQSVAACQAELATLKATIASEGVNLSLVYTLARLEAILDRMRTLADILGGRIPFADAFVPLLTRLIGETRRGKSLRALWRDNAAMLSRRITDRNAHTGHHYITRNRPEYLAMILAAGGGGAITAATVVGKLIAMDLPFSILAQGTIISLNYVASFLLIQALGFTLATKQPAMTAAAIASHITDLADDREVGKLIREIIHLIRSQVAAIIGNLAGVIPVAVVLFFALRAVCGGPLLSKAQAMELLQEHSILGWSPVFAAFTGILLWLSSLVAGWTDNWVALNDLPGAIRNNRRLRFLLRPSGAARLASVTQASAAGVGGNTSLGFLLGLAPKVLAFAGIPLQVRHVTLATGTLAFAAAALGSDVWRQHALWQAVACIPLLGFLNVAVSFWIALSVALKARNVGAAGKRRIYLALLSRILRRPLQILLPIGLEPK